MTARLAAILLTLAPSLWAQITIPQGGGLLIYKDNPILPDAMSGAIVFSKTIPRGASAVLYIGNRGESALIPDGGTIAVYNPADINVLDLDPGTRLEHYRGTMNRLIELSHLNQRVEVVLAPIIQGMRANIEMVEGGKVLLHGEWKANPNATPLPMQRVVKQEHLKSLITTEGETYRNVTYKSSDEQKVSFSHTDGAARVSWDNLKKEDQLLWGYDAEKAKAIKLAKEKEIEEKRQADELAQQKAAEEKRKADALAKKQDDEQRAKEQEAQKQRLALTQSNAEAVSRVQVMAEDKLAVQNSQNQTLDLRIASEKAKQASLNAASKNKLEDSDNREALIKSKVSLATLEEVHMAEEGVRKAQENLRVAIKNQKTSEPESVNAVVLAQKAEEPAAEKRELAYRKLNQERYAIIVALNDQEAADKLAKENDVIKQEQQSAREVQMEKEQQEEANKTRKRNEAERQENAINESLMQKLKGIPDADGVVVGPKVKGVQLGMDIRNAQQAMSEVVKESGCGIGDIRPLNNNNPDKIYYAFDILAPDPKHPGKYVSYPFMRSFVGADVEGKVIIIQITEVLTESIFKARRMSSQEFARQFMESYALPKMEATENKQALFNTSDDGAKVVIDMRKNIIIKKVPSLSDKARSFN